MAQKNVPKEKESEGKVKRYMQGVRTEFKRVSWPTRDEWLKYCLVVIAVSIVTALVVYAVDFLISSLISFLINL